MKFVDSCDVDVVAGKGGNGVIAFRREKFIPFGGPAGGDGGKGGDIVFATDEGMSTLLDLTYGRLLRAASGEHGQGKDCYGRAGKDLVVRVPVGTQIYDRESGALLFDLDAPRAKVVVAQGGRGGRGNIHFATPHDRAPRRAEPGVDGQERRLRLELKVMADVGLLGFPNVGKSTFIRACSRAQPKVADYPFTTLTPHLGVVRVGDEATFVVADIPGLIPGAAEGAGLGHRFLKHVERCRALLHLVTLDSGEERDPLADYDALVNELGAFDEELAKRPQIVAMTKADLPEVREAFEKAKKAFSKRKVSLRLVSAATGEGIRELCIDLYKLVTGRARVEDWETPALAEAGEPSVEGATRPLAPTERDRKTKTAKTTKPKTKTPKPTTAKKAISAKAKTKTPKPTTAKKATSAKTKTKTPKPTTAKKATSAKAKTKTPKPATAKKTANAKAKTKTSKPTTAKKTANAKAKTKTPKPTAAKKAKATSAKKTRARAKKAKATTKKAARKR